MILMLEDNDERLERFTSVLHKLCPSIPFVYWKDAHSMMREAGPMLASTVLLSLDHDLEPEPNAKDPGEGYMVVKWLTSQPIVRPVIIHSSNGTRSTWMAGEFDLARWKHWRVAPLGDDWIEYDWRIVVKKLLKKQGHPFTR